MRLRTKLFFMSWIAIIMAFSLEGLVPQIILNIIGIPAFFYGVLIYPNYMLLVLLAKGAEQHNKNMALAIKKAFDEQEKGV